MENNLTNNKYVWKMWVMLDPKKWAGAKVVFRGRARAQAGQLEKSGNLCFVDVLWGSKGCGMSVRSFWRQFRAMNSAMCQIAQDFVVYRT